MLAARAYAARNEAEALGRSARLVLAVVHVLELPPSTMEPTYGEAADTLAVVRCVECGRPQQPDELGESWHLRFADIGEIAIYCPACAEREFAEHKPLIRCAGGSNIASRSSS
jgi:hypothetical protein